MFRVLPRRLLVAVILLATAHHSAHGQGRDIIRISYPDSLKAPGLKLEVASFLSNYVMAGFELPLKKNRFFELNMGMSGLLSDNYYEDEGKTRKGFVLRSGFKFPIVYTTAMSMCYLMPEYAFSGFSVTGFDYNTGNLKDYTIRSNAILLNFGFRHVNPHSGFFYDIGVGYGVGFTNNVAYGTYAYVFFISESSYYDNVEYSYSGLASSFRGSIGWVLKKKNN